MGGVLLTLDPVIGREVAMISATAPPPMPAVSLTSVPCAVSANLLAAESAPKAP
jgi:hypothetical protein